MEGQISIWEVLNESVVPVLKCTPAKSIMYYCGACNTLVRLDNEIHKKAKPIYYVDVCPHCNTKVRYEDMPDPNLPCENCKHDLNGCCDSEIPCILGDQWVIKYTQEDYDRFVHEGLAEKENG